jgi:hypothetical protein
MMNLKTFALFTLTSIFICSEAFALSEATSDDNVVRENTPIFHLYDDLDLISSQKIIYGKPRIVIKAIYPRLESDVSRDNIDTFNDIIANLIKEEAEEFQKNVKVAYKNLSTIPKSGKNELFIDYNSSSVQSGRYHILSIRMSMQGMMNGMAHPYHYYRALNYNLDTGETIQLADLFREESDYLEVLANYAKKTLSRRLDNKEMVDLGTTPTIDHYRIWNIKPSGILITFEDNQVAPYVFGAQTVLVPYSVLRSLFSSQNPITKCMRRLRCNRRHLLTGGFMEEASIKTSHRFFNPILRQG